LNCLTRFFTIFCVSSGTAIWRRSTRPHEQSDTSRRWSQTRTRNERRRIRPRLVGRGHDETKVGGFCYLCEPCGGDATVRAAAAAAGVRGKDRLLLWRRDNPSNVVGFICSKKCGGLRGWPATGVVRCVGRRKLRFSSNHFCVGLFCGTDGLCFSVARNLRCCAAGEGNNRIRGQVVSPPTACRAQILKRPLGWNHGGRNHES
jgi:hypothetical protein